MSEQQSAFDYLVTLTERGRAVLDNLPSQREKLEQLWNGVGFALGEQRCVLPMGDVSEVLVEPSVTRLPGVKNWVKGVANVRGRLLPLVDLVAFLGMQSAGGGARRVLVLERGDVFIGLVVDEVYGMQYFSRKSFQKESDSIATEVAPFVVGAYRQGTREWAVFQSSRLLEDAAFFNVAA